MKISPTALLFPALLALAPLLARAEAAKPAKPVDGAKIAQEEHGAIGVKESAQKAKRNMHPDALWYPDAGLGLFLHWGISSVDDIGISWPMIPGRALGVKRISDPVERARIIREGDYNLTGKPSLTPNQYWKMAPRFNPQAYDPEKWIVAAKAAGFNYAVLTAKHHDGFAMWPSAYGALSTKNFMGGRDLVKPFVDACRKHGMKVGIYFSPLDWHVCRNHTNFLYYRARGVNPELPYLDADLQPTKAKHTKAEMAAHLKEYAAIDRGQIEELLTNYGKIDMLWFDGSVAGVRSNDIITQQRIRELQPGIIISPRLHGYGDFRTYERHLPVDKPATDWAEFCNTWNDEWTYGEAPLKSNAYVLGELVRSRSLNINYLLGVGPDKDGELFSEVYKRMAEIAPWMNKNGESIRAVHALPKGETATVDASAAGDIRYLYAIPKFKDTAPPAGSPPNTKPTPGSFDADKLPPADLTLTLSGVAKPTAVTLLGDGAPLAFTHAGDTLTIPLPASRQSGLVDVVKVALPAK